MHARRSLIALAVLLAASLVPATAQAEAVRDLDLRFAPEEGLDAIQPGCTTLDVEDNPCHQMATGMNGLDSPKIDILVLVPASPFAERDLRVMRQSAEMWADGVKFLAADLGLDWMVEGVEFHIFLEMLSLTGGEAEFTTYPIIDPEIVIVASNPLGGIGIGIDPIDFVGQLFGEGQGQGPCHGVKNPFDIALWEVLPGWDSHHAGRSGTYVEDCDGAGGNICFSVNAAIDPLVPQDLVDFQLYDLVSHETGHCLTLGHVGDGAEGSWSAVPTNDIMAYSSDPPGVSKCVSTLDVEALALTMSHFLDVNGDGVVNSDDYLHANDATGDPLDARAFQIQHPDNHYYASPTRKAIDCPQPDLGLVPLVEVVNFTPLAPLRPQVSIVGRYEQQVVAQGAVNVQGLVEGVLPQAVVLSVLAAPDLNGTQLNLTVLNVTVPVRGDGSFSGNLDLSSVPDGTTVVVAAQWLDPAGLLVDSDRVALLVSLAEPIDQATVGAADAGIGSGQRDDDSGSSDTPSPALALVALALLAAVVVRRRKA